MSLRPAGATGAPSTSTVNVGLGTFEPNAATVDLSADGKIQIYAFILGVAPSVHVLVDVVGYTVDHNHNDIYYTTMKSTLRSKRASRSPGTSAGTG